MGGLSIRVRFDRSRCVIPGLAAGVAGRAADQVGDRRRPVFGLQAGTPGSGAGATADRLRRPTEKRKVDSSILSLTTGSSKADGPFALH
jgi:hypothetical protein